ncbi:transposase domain-containing protein [Paraburkholderia youngii]|uniref:transposase domain-containing protein n=1 Tax=Paraburkholderia TaxID=1822464 RepID=UPI0035D413E3
MTGGIPSGRGSRRTRHKAGCGSPQARGLHLHCHACHASHLPDDIAALKRIVASRDETIAQLLAEISRLKRWQYGRSSERMTELMDQLQLALGELPVGPSAADAQTGYSLIGTARLNGIEPFAYLRTVFERIADHPINRIDELLPWRLKPAAYIEQQAA